MRILIDKCDLGVKSKRGCNKNTLRWLFAHEVMQEAYFSIKVKVCETWDWEGSTKYIYYKKLLNLKAIFMEIIKPLQKHL